MTSNLLEIKDLSVEYKSQNSFGKGKNVFAVNKLTLAIKKGEILAVAGESGCGKSTLAKAILRLIPVSDGQILLNGSQNIVKFNKKEFRAFQRKAQMVFQNPYSSLNPKMKIYDILKEPLIIHEKNLSKAEINQRVVDTIKLVGLEESSLYLYPHEFSGGQRQRIAIARALILKPEFILADEPVSALDVSIQGQIINLLNELREKFNLTFLFISHDLNVIRYLADRVAIMYLGEIVEIGTCDEIFNNPKHPYTKALLSANPGNKQKEIILKGELPSPTELPQGCKFHTRCPLATKVCMQEAIMTKFTETHSAKCHLYDDLKN